MQQKLERAAGTFALGNDDKNRMLERLTAAEKRMQELTEISDALKRDLENERSEKAAFIEGHTQKEIFNKIATEQNFAMPKESAFKLFRTEYKVVEKDGNIEVGGNTDNLVKYSKLDLSLQNEATLINTELGKIAAVLNSLAPGSYVPTPVTIDISQSKCDKVKTS